MAADDARAQRIRDTWLERKADDPKHYTWGRIASAVGTTERAAQDWQKTGGIDYDNAKKLAKYLGVDFDWLWRGDEPAPAKTETPDPFGETQLDRLERSVGQLHDALRINHALLEVILRNVTEQNNITEQLEDAIRLPSVSEGLAELLSREAPPRADETRGRPGSRRPA